MVAEPAAAIKIPVAVNVLSPKGQLGYLAKSTIR